MHAHQTSACRIVAGSLLALLIVAPALPVSGQQEQSSEFPSYRLPGWSFLPAVAIGATYDTNVALSSPRASEGGTEGDSLFNVIPSAQLEYLGKRTEFSAAYRGFLRRYTEVEGLDEFAQRGTLGFKHAFSRRSTFFVRNSFADQPTTDEVEVNGVPFRRMGSRTNTFAAGTDYRITKFTSFATRYDLTWVEFDRPDEFLTGGWIHAIRNELTHAVTDRLTVGGEHSYRVASLDQGQRDLGFQDAGGVLRFVFGPHTTGSISGGFAMLHDRTADVRRSGPYVRMGVTHALERATLGAGYARQYVPSFGFGGASSSQELTGYVTMPFIGNRLYTQASGSWRRTSPFEEQVLELDTIVLKSTLGYALARWARVEGVYAYTRQDSVITGGEVDRHRIGVQFVVSQPMRIR
jgi:hypothetical protein